jgi:hypothetical protein
MPVPGARPSRPGVLDFARRAAAQTSSQPKVQPVAPKPANPPAAADVPDMEIPTFIRRQMD